MKALSPDIPHRFLCFVIPTALFLLLLRIGENLVGVDGSYHPILLLLLFIGGFVYLQIRITFPSFEGFGLVRLYIAWGLYVYIAASIFSYDGSYLLFALNPFHSWIISLSLVFVFFMETSLWRLRRYSEMKHSLAIRKGNELIEEIRSNMVVFSDLVEHLRRLYRLLGLYLLLPFIASVLLYQRFGLSPYDAVLLIFTTVILFIGRGIVSSFVRNLEFLAEGIHPGHDHHWPVYRQALAILGITFVPTFVLTYILPVLNIGLFHDLLFNLLQPMDRAFQSVHVPQKNPWSSIAEQSDFTLPNSEWLEILAIALYVFSLLILVLSLGLVVLYIIYPLLNREQKQFWNKVNLLKKLVHSLISAAKSILFFFSSQRNAGLAGSELSGQGIVENDIQRLIVTPHLNQKQHNKIVRAIADLFNWGNQQGKPYIKGLPLGRYCASLVTELQDSVTDVDAQEKVKEIGVIIERILYSDQDESLVNKGIKRLDKLVKTL